MEKSQSAGVSGSGFAFFTRQVDNSTTNNGRTFDNSAADMRVIEVIIDGFKSYAVRTVISGWYDICPK